MNCLGENAQFLTVIHGDADCISGKNVQNFPCPYPEGTEDKFIYSCTCA